MSHQAKDLVDKSIDKLIDLKRETTNKTMVRQPNSGDNKDSCVKNNKGKVVMPNSKYAQHCKLCYICIDSS